VEVAATLACVAAVAVSMAPVVVVSAVARVAEREPERGDTGNACSNSGSAMGPTQAGTGGGVQRNGEGLRPTGRQYSLGLCPKGSAQHQLIVGLGAPQDRQHLGGTRSFKSAGWIVCHV
jgi:hypothetical protein